ncbi:HAD-IIB family hydrolase, partial [Parabacteroides goldsteinii]
PFYLEVVPKGIDKAASLERLLERVQIKREEVIAIGDGYNDLSMIKFAGLGVAMANAQPPVKSNADRITAFTNDEDGVAHFIHDLLNSNTHQNIHEIG